MKLEEILQLNPRETLLLVIDIQKDFLESQPGFTFFDAGVDLSNMQQMVRANLLPFVLGSLDSGVKVAYSKAYYPINKFPPPFDKLCSAVPGTDFYLIGGIKGIAKVKVFAKSEHDPFTNQELADYVERNGIKDVILTGVTLTHCIEEAAKSAVRRGLRAIIPSDCVSYRTERTQQAMEILGRYSSPEEKRVVVVNSGQIRYS